MNRLVFVNINIFVIAIGLCPVAKADYIALELPTQVNKQTDLFDKSINDYSGFTNKLEQGKQAGIDSLGGENGTPEGLQYISKDNKSQINSESQKLESIHENDLASKGREKIIKEGHLQKLYPDYNRPGYKQHLQDAKTIAKAQDELLKHLLEKLKALGVDCKTVKGDKKVEPEYFLQTKTTTHKDTLYNQVFCEELRNQYNCRDELSLTCKRFGIRWTHWEDKAMLLDGVWIYRAHMGWFYPLQWTSDRYGLHLREGHPAVQAEMRLYIAANEGVNIENIHEHIIYGARGEGNTVHADKNMYAFQVYRVHYKIRRGEEICEEWQEDWTERCNLK